MSAHEAFLRIYEPLAAFDEQQRACWQRYVSEGRSPSPADAAELERSAALRAMLGRPHPVLPDLEEHAHVTELDGVTLVCPWRTRLRSLEALEEFVTDLPDEVVGAFVPPALAADVGDVLDAWRVEHQDERSHQLGSRWSVPLRWFVLVDDDERELRLGSPQPAGAAAGLAPAARSTGRSLVYRTAMSRARRRTAKALAVLRTSLEDSAVTEGVDDLGRWLEDFHPRSLVELDYGGLVHLMDDTALQQDTSARDIAQALSALAGGDEQAAMLAYGRITGRMKALQAVESAS